MRTSAAIPIHPRVMKRSRTGFTLIEVLVVVAIIALLVSILLPSLARAKEASRRAICASRLHNMGVSVHEYSYVNKGKIIECMASPVSTANDSDGYAPMTQICIAPRKAVSGGAGGKPEDYVDWQGQAKKYHLDKELWECPNRQGMFKYEGNPGAAQGYYADDLKRMGYAVDPSLPYQQWIIGYQYFGGMVEWLNDKGVFKARSPRDSNAKPQWALAADSNIRTERWGAGRASAYGNIPPHPRADGKPEGGNVLTFDGAVNWIRYARDGQPSGRVLKYISGWHSSGRDGYWYQSDLGDMVR